MLNRLSHLGTPIIDIFLNRTKKFGLLWTRASSLDTCFWPLLQRSHINLKAPWLPFPTCPAPAQCLGLIRAVGERVRYGNKVYSCFSFFPWRVQIAMGWTKKKRTTMFHSSGKSTAAATPQGQAFWTGRNWPSSASSFIWKSSCPSFCKHFLEMTTLPGWVFDFILTKKSTEYCS